MIKLIVLSVLLNAEDSNIYATVPTETKYSKLTEMYTECVLEDAPIVPEARRRGGKGDKKRRRGGNGLR